MTDPERLAEIRQTWKPCEGAPDCPAIYRDAPRRWCERCQQQFVLAQLDARTAQIHAAFEEGCNAMHASNRVTNYAMLGVDEIIGKLWAASLARRTAGEHETRRYTKGE